jgi:hypothetical protein
LVGKKYPLVNCYITFIVLKNEAPVRAGTAPSLAVVLLLLLMEELLLAAVGRW